MGWERIRLSYKRQMQKGPTEVCVCCGGLFFSTKVSKVKMSKIIEWGCTEETANTVFSVEPVGEEY